MTPKQAETIAEMVGEMVTLAAAVAVRRALSDPETKDSIGVNTLTDRFENATAKLRMTLRDLTTTFEVDNAIQAEVDRACRSRLRGLAKGKRPR